jgi:hypothetical protein
LTAQEDTALEREDDMTDKGSLGYPSPNKEVQDAFADLRQHLNAKKADWESQRGAWAKLQTAFIDIAAKSAKARVDNPNIVVALLLAMSAEQNCKLGVELAETHDRLAAVEKVVRDLKMRE